MSTFSLEIRGRLNNYNYWEPLDKCNTIWRTTGHLFSRYIICLHPTRVRKHSFACMNTYGILTVTYKAGFGLT